MNQILERSLFQKVEKLESFEDRLKVRLENISIRIMYEASLTIFLEVHPVKGTNIEESVDIQCVIYDTDGAILRNESHRIYDDNFFGLEVVTFLILNINLDDIGKIRIYPKKC